MIDKVDHAKILIEDAIKDYEKVGVACSFGKDSMVTVHLAREVDSNVKIFSIMTQYKPKETFEYLRLMNREMNLGTTVYIVADRIPESLRDNSLEVILLSTEEFRKRTSQIETQTGNPIYLADPDECCRMLKVEPTKAAVKNLDAWICGLRSTEGITRVDFKEIEDKGGIIKINPILTFTEAEIWRYIATRGIKPHPYYGIGFRSLGCAPCSYPGGESERSCRWRGTSKCGGECGIHTRRLK